jgi:hypothetical protein
MKYRILNPESALNGFNDNEISPIFFDQFLRNKSRLRERQIFRRSQ